MSMNHEAVRLFVAAVTFDCALILGLVAAQAKGMAFFHVPVLVRRKVCVFVAGITFIFSLMLGMGKYGGFFGGVGL